MRRVMLPAALLGALFLPAPASAACYEDVGCTDSDRFSSRELARLASCQVLWEMRNMIYFENGYCFSTARGRNVFGNAGCRFDDAAAVPLNVYERDNVDAIKRAERTNGCS